eukprot:403816_1
MSCEEGGIKDIKSHCSPMNTSIINRIYDIDIIDIFYSESGNAALMASLIPPGIECPLRYCKLTQGTKQATVHHAPSTHIAFYVLEVSFIHISSRSTFHLHISSRYTGTIK